MSGTPSQEWTKNISGLHERQPHTRRAKHHKTVSSTTSVTPGATSLLAGTRRPHGSELVLSESFNKTLLSKDWGLEKFEGGRHREQRERRE